MCCGGSNMILRLLIGAFGLILLTGGSGATANTFASSYLKLRVESVEGIVSLSPVGQLVDPQCAKNVCVFRYPIGSTVTLTAAPGRGSSFIGWERLYTNRPNPCGGPHPVCTAVINEIKATKAIFSPLRLTTAWNPGGSIDVKAAGGRTCGSRCYEFNHRTLVTLIPVANSDHHLESWGGYCEGVSRRSFCEFPLKSNTAVSAFFVRNDGTARQEHPVTKWVDFRTYTRPAGRGTVKGTDGLSCPPKCSIRYQRGRQIALIATPVAGGRFLGWSGACVKSREETCVIQASPPPSGKSRVVTAYFSP
jgi:Divergent InlB B-repeat domain